MNKKNIAVIYHKNCPDGFGAAWAAWKKFGNNAEYFGVDPHELPQKKIKNKEIFVLDNCLFKKEQKLLLKANKNLTVIDHHFSNEKEVGAAPNFVFDLNHSAAILSWNFFHPKKKMPKLFEHIEDLDLWKFKLPNTYKLSTLFRYFDYDFKVWDKLIKDFRIPKKRILLIELAKTLSFYEDKYIETILKNAELVKFGKYKIYALNSPILNSQIGARLHKKLPPMSIVWHERDGFRFISLRSNDSVDVSKIAKKFGGGGHKKAAGFKLSVKKPFPWKVLRKVLGSKE